MFAIDRDYGHQPRLNIGFKRIGGSFEKTRDGDGNLVLWGCVWLARGRRLHYRYPSVTFVGWRPVFAIQ